ncbi:MAG: serine/threonine protein kinase [Myxococcales bacterium]|nr:serine/threonine protein kinase [Myxococcales bacterium]
MLARSEIPPDTLLGGKIRLIKRIGRGGMGDVWVARNEATQAEVAVKTLHRFERSPVHDERFRREARLSATISHRNVVRVFDLVDEADGTLGLVMELLRGSTLEDAMRERGALSALQAVAVAVPVLSAMHHVHQKGIVHRDVKPANVFFAVEPDGHVIPKLLDFGIAKLPAAGSALTMDGSVLGTPHYMSPEQIRGQEDLDGRSDMFAFAVLLYEMLTGVRVFQRDAAAASLAAVLEHEVDPDPRIEPRLWLAISRALAKRPYERFATCAELAEALRRAIDATDELLAQSLQELRPQTEAGTSRSTSPSSLAISSERPVVEAPRGNKAKTLAIAGGAALGAAVIAIGLTLGPSRPPDPVTTGASVPVSTVPAVEPAISVPPPSEAPAPAPSAEPAPPAAEPGSTAVRAVATARPTTTVKRPPAPGDKKPPKPRPTATAGGVATTPGF